MSWRVIGLGLTRNGTCHDLGGQEVCDVLEVTQEGCRCDYRSKITHAFMTWLHDGASNPKPMWTRVGVWGNTLVRASDVQEHRSVTSYTGRPTWKGVQLFKSHQSLRVLREEENDRAIGGLRNPTRAVAGNPASRHVGSQKHPQFVAMVSELRSTTNRDVSQLSRLAVQVGTVAAQEVVVSLGLKCGIERAHGRYRAELVAELMNAMHDPDKEVALWLRGHTPVGIHHPIVPSGVFPTASVTKAQLESLQYFYQIQAKGEFTTVNYTSFEEHAEEARAELHRLVDRGHLEEVGSWEDVVARWPDARPVRVAVSVTLKSDGTTKVRFILDALRNGTNGLIQVQERVVLPRAHDVVTDIFDLLEPLEPQFESNGKMDWGVELLVVDFRTRSYPSS